MSPRHEIRNRLKLSPDFAVASIASSNGAHAAAVGSISFFRKMPLGLALMPLGLHRHLGLWNEFWNRFTSEHSANQLITDAGPPVSKHTVTLLQIRTPQHA